MLIQSKWAKVVALALSLPSTIFGLALVTDALIKSNVVPKTLGWLIFILIIINSIFLMVWYALRVKGKDKS
ncbi:hypothetical protein M899_0007 [Bacteriovorax sp. BSW11_IV]|uniref:hypothetical protein n=1 Tax=Bacteriovorax sp. BSW11_IV TaxID=1353529 RepID=UPI00038A1E69|nr:hypothetical protein [Bacteriovorax sp. BSW11_IV]EQC50048.1 hypothetical protein M899_0007 [Bacteriovorax sp. BSW11_IV]